MSARVYALDAAEAPALKKMLEYDPYLDQNTIPKMPKEWSDAKYRGEHPELAQQIEAKEKEIAQALDRLKNDKETNIIFARQDYQLKDGISLGLDREKSYLYLSANDLFLDGADAKLKKNFKSIQRADAETEQKVIGMIEEEKSRADAGMGLIFG